MSKSFIEAQHGKSDVLKAVRQEEQLSYFTVSEIQENYLTDEYLKQYSERKFQGNDYFLNFVKSVFKTENFLSFFRFMRKPVPSAKIINNKIVPQLRRIFNAENAEFKYVVAGYDDIDFDKILKTNEFEQELFSRILFQHNSILVSGLSDGNPYRFFVDIKRVKSIECSQNGEIKRLAFAGSVDGVAGYIYVDESSFIFYDKNFNPTGISYEHGLDHCPAYFITKTSLFDNPIVKESIFTYIREELEEYVFLKTLQKMTEPNGAIPIITRLDVDILEENKMASATPDDITSGEVGGQTPSIFATNPPTGDSVLQTGSEFKIPVVEKVDGSIDTDIVTNLIKFHYIPVESLNYLKTRISEIELSIVHTIIGGIIDGLKEGSKNEAQVEEALSVLQNTLIYFADTFNYIRTKSDTDMLKMKYGSRVSSVYIFYGSDFFLDSESGLYRNLELARNPIEKKNVLIRINQNRYKGNINKQQRQTILYDLIPFVDDADFDKAVAAARVDEVTFDYQTRFNYWISKFESTYGDIVAFYSGLEVEKPLRLKTINELIINLIKEK